MVNEPILIVKHILLYMSDYGLILVFANEMALLSTHNICLRKRKHVRLLTLKSPFTAAADDKFCEIFPNFREK